MPHTTAVILAAGLGTRMKSKRPKVLHEVLGRPMLFYAIDVAFQAGVDDIVLVLGYERDAIEAAVSEAYPEARIRVALQPEQRGTGHAVICALEEVPAEADEVLVLSGDVPNLGAETVEELIDATRRGGTPVGFITAIVDEPGGYGRVVRDAQQRVVAIVEDKDATPEQRLIREINVGAYLFEAAFLRQAVGGIDDENAAAELYLTALVEATARSGRPASALVALEPETIRGVNSRVGLATAEAWARRRLNERWMSAGVTMLDPERTYIEATVQLAQDVTLGPGVILQGSTSVGRGTRIETGCVVRDCTIGEAVQVLAHSYLEQSEVREGASVGPFGRLRPLSVLLEGAKIGNFVEVKKSVIGKGSKASHLSYLGDALIGDGVNVGAGTITCNYDGRKKSQTVLEDGVFIGSDSQLVAPVRIGKDAYVGAGTTVTRDVPPGALAVSRAPEKHIEGYTAMKRARWEREAK